MSYKETEAYKAHQKLGFPKLEDEVQLELLVTHNHKPIKDLCPEIKSFPFGLLNEYITVSKSQLKNYLDKVNYVEKQLRTFSKKHDGFWLKKDGENYVFFERERGLEFNHVELGGINEVLEFYANHLGSWCK
ncbi:hypothetical protein [Jiulongibacter sediminis]|jgi:hypothetical protein|uniref:hypothetical protein n=1 Tax=Jiulongibacter sediminis TaxID=1605367 RepID=UPI0026EC6BA7|nr:hypothetical protein [Jiulongibacter sediminis]